MPTSIDRDWGSRLGEVEGIVEFAVGQQSGIAGHLGADESEPETAVEVARFGSHP